jgi:hypothetical protein
MVICLNGFDVQFYCLKFLKYFRIVAFIGSPVEADEKELMKIAKKLKKEKVNVDIVSFGEDQVGCFPVLSSRLGS